MLHFVPTSCSWLNLVEYFFSIITRQAIRRGSFASVSEIPTHANPPSGCVFHTRCPRYIGGICRNEEPDFKGSNRAFLALPLLDRRAAQPVARGV